MIKVIDINSKSSTQADTGRARTLLSPAADGTRVSVEIRDVDPGKTYSAAASDRTQVVYILEGRDAKSSYTNAAGTKNQTQGRRTGVYLEPGERASITAAA